MTIEALHRYGADLDAVAALFHDPAFMKAKYAAIGARNVEVPECRGDDGGYTVRITREVPAEAPALLARFVSPWNVVTQRERWTREPGGPWRCRIDIEIAGVPVAIAGAMELRAEGDGCVNDVRLDATCNIPFVGGRLADFVGGNVERAVQAEYDFIRRHLAAA